MNLPPKVIIHNRGFFMFAIVAGHCKLILQKGALDLNGASRTYLHVCDTTRTGCHSFGGTLIDRARVCVNAVMGYHSEGRGNV